MLFDTNFLTGESLTLEVLVFLILRAIQMCTLRFSFLLNFILCQKQVPAQLGFLPSVPRGLENIKEGVGGQSRDTGTRTPPNTGTPGSLQQRGSLWLLTASLPFKASLHKEVPSPAGRRRKTNLPWLLPTGAPQAAGPRRGEGTAFTTKCTYLEKSWMVKCFDRSPRTQQFLLRG